MIGMENTNPWTTAYRAFLFFSTNLLILAAAFYWWRISELPVEPDIIFNKAQLPFYNPKMTPRLLYFALATFFVGISLLISLINAFYLKNSLFSKYKFFYNFFILFLGLVLSLVVHSAWLAAFPVVMFIGAFLNPKWIGLLPVTDTPKNFELLLKTKWQNTNEAIDRIQARIYLPKKFQACFIWAKKYDKIFNFQCVGIVVWFCASLCLVFLAGEKIWQTHKVLNPYSRIPNYYKISMPEGEFYINTTELINKMNLWGAHDKIDISNIDAWKKDKSCISVGENDSILSEFVDKVNKDANPKIGDFFSPSFKYPPRLFYGEGKLCVEPAAGNDPISNKKLNDALMIQLKQITGQDMSDVKERINRYNDSGILNYSDIIKRMDPDLYLINNIISSYKSSTSWENMWQSTFRGDIRHQAYYILPVHEYLNGKPLNKIQHFYGVGYTFIVGKIVKLFSKSGQINWGKTMRIIAAITLVSMCLITLTMLGIFKDFRVISLCLLIYLLKNIAVGFENYAVSCGQCDLRVVFDFIVLYSFYRYTNEKNIYIAFMLLIFSGFEICFFFEFGAGLILACFASLFILCVLEKNINKLDFIVLFTNIFLLIIGYLISQIGNRDISNYFFKGILAGPMKSHEIFIPLVVFCFYLLAFVYMRRNNSKYSILFLFCVFYSHVISVYYIWNGGYHHYISYALRHALPIIIFLHFLFNEKIKYQSWSNVAYVSSVFVMSMFICTSFQVFHKNQNLYESSFRTQKTYKWKDEDTNFKTTLNKTYFDNAVLLINKYISNEEKGIYLISQYSDLLLFLSKKYSEMPSFDLFGYLLTPKENDKVINLITSNRPEYLFVDSDIDSPYIFDIVSPYLYGFMYNETLYKSISMTEFSNIFKKVRNDYELIESGELISVYKRRKEVSYEN